MDGGIIEVDGYRPVQEVMEEVLAEHGHSVSECGVISAEYLQEQSYRAETQRAEAMKEKLAAEKPAPEASISFYVAECAEFPVMGEFHDNLTLEQALEVYDKIPAKRMNGIKSIGFSLEDGSIYKSKKNNNDRTQYRQKNHHEAIVSREVFNAANHLRASRNYSKKNRPLPVLSVVEDGILRGYVPFDKDWTGFSAEEYREASESVMKEPDAAVTADVKKRLDLTGYEVVRAQYFSTMQNPAMTISNGRLRFNTACLKKFENVEYVELLLNSVDRCIAIRPCDKNNPNAIRWGRLKEGRWCASTLGCRGLAKALFDIMEWDEDLRYRFRGQFLEQGDNKMMLFAFDEPEMIKVEEIVLPPKESTEEDEGETVKKKIYIFPPEWAGTFGQPITSIAQVGILRQEHYAGNWDVFRPASEIEEMNTFTAESLNKLLHEAEKIMEGWTDIDE